MADASQLLGAWRTIVVTRAVGTYQALYMYPKARIYSDQSFCATGEYCRLTKTAANPKPHNSDMCCAFFTALFTHIILLCSDCLFVEAGSGKSGDG